MTEIVGPAQTTHEMRVYFIVSIIVWWIVFSLIKHFPSMRMRWICWRAKRWSNAKKIGWQLNENVNRMPVRVKYGRYEITELKTEQATDKEPL